MTKVEEVKALINDSSVSDETIEVYLAIANDKILNKMYPFSDYTDLAIPSKYDHLQCELASRYIFRRGVEGQRSFQENGVMRTYDSVDDSDILNKVTQVVGVI